MRLANYLGNLLLVLVTSVVLDGKAAPSNTGSSSKSKASVWVDMNKGTILSSSSTNGAVNNSNPNLPKTPNMMITLLLQPNAAEPVRLNPDQSGSQSGGGGSGSGAVTQAQIQPLFLMLQQLQDQIDHIYQQQSAQQQLLVSLQQTLVKHHSSLEEVIRHLSSVRVVGVNPKDLGYDESSTGATKRPDEPTKKPK